MYKGPKADRASQIEWDRGEGLEILVCWGIDPLKHYIDSLEWGLYLCRMYDRR